ncbi:hypothetical protein CBU_1378 [Coxiella burnetii RSA 493]|uniref:Uncharacterized protein n=1 Tax=Coxiella burnetii (strain RSA 493 / Nine Mile phase I) TaxID=227377 RepID=Q83BV9_COXBU|nr:hypothetical protein CBU_1378 [Coxiella burnetii RSA 493]BBL36611.1 hypothetical protein CBU406_C06080 [Coxiella burnetii]BBL39059.1 hypothetical protein CBUVS42_C13230 [Coxiella burnetii]
MKFDQRTLDEGKLKTQNIRYLDFSGWQYLSLLKPRYNC